MFSVFLVLVPQCRPRAAAVFDLYSEYVSSKYVDKIHLTKTKTPDEGYADPRKSYHDLIGYDPFAVLWMESHMCKKKTC